MPFLVATPVSAGERFGRVVVVRELESVKSPNGTVRRRVECRCDCGTIKVFGLPALRNGHTKSCGCLRVDARREGMRTHGGTGTPEHKIWLGMKRRCKDLNDRNYGGRGIMVCERWEKSFEAFLADMGPRPSPEHSIDRYPDQNGNYEPGNCRWATRSQQARNMRVNVLIERNGETLCLAEWAERFGMSPSLLAGRLNSGWTFDEAIDVKLRQNSMVFRMTPISKRDAAWYREYERREQEPA